MAIQLRSVWLALVGALAVLFAALGCAGSLDGRPNRAIDREAVITAIRANSASNPATLIDQYYALDPSAESARKNARNQFLDLSILLIDQYYSMFVDEFSSLKKGLDTGADLASIGTDLAAVLVGAASTKAILAAISGGITAGQASFNKNYFYEQTVPVLIKQMESQRRAVYADILKGTSLSTEAYPLTAALGDLERYYFAGTFDGALNAIQQQAAEQELDAEKDIKVFQANNDPEANTLRQSFAAWLADGAAAMNASRVAALDAYIRAQFGFTQGAGLWLASAPTEQLRAATLHFAVPRLTPEQQAERERGNRERVESEQEATKRRMAEAQAWIEENGDDAARARIRAWLESQADDVVLRVANTVAIRFGSADQPWTQEIPIHDPSAARTHLESWLPTAHREALAFALGQWSIPLSAEE